MWQDNWCFAVHAPLAFTMHDAAMKLYCLYLIVGGMLKCVMQFWDNGHRLIEAIGFTILC